jgi:hypothetical protein
VEARLDAVGEGSGGEGRALEGGLTVQGRVARTLGGFEHIVHDRIQDPLRGSIQDRGQGRHQHAGLADAARGTQQVPDPRS